ncbi:amidohydrolase family protein [Sphingopyxis sp.]|uniref:amidohydrolase family protein n=1 Tax=Sphingopyxis sp. TaxID=1908224 RepID=UPI00260D1EDD|nr:amidohydrolase family protein [Sphingopyxis sp.]MCW0197772.1 amidohydrolase family protein [Sphingopyxis sp.]
MKAGRAVALLLALLPVPAAAETVAIVNGRVHSLSARGVIEKGTVLIEDDRIVAVGDTVTVPADARVVDAGGRPVTPGLFSAYSQLGLVEVETVASTQDQSAAGAPFAAGFAVHYGINPASTIIPTARVEGVTRGAIFPIASRSIFGGIGALIQTGDGAPPLFEPRALALVELGSAGAAAAGGARGAAWITLEEALRTAPETQGPDGEALRALLAGRMPMVAHVERAPDIEQLIAFAARHPSIRVVMLGATEGWMVADRIAAAKIPVIVDSYANLPVDFETMAATQENAARLAKAGVTIAIAPLNRFSAGAPHDARLVAQYAGNAVGNGLPWDEALKAVTLNPATIFGVADRLGSIEPGKLADIVVWRGDPLDIGDGPAAVFVAGRQMPMDTRQTRLAERYKALLSGRE